MKNTNLLYSPKFPLDKTDFSPVPMHRILFVAIAKLSETGANEVTELEIDNWTSNYPSAYEILQDGNFMEFIATVKELAISENFELYYNAIRKFSLLRDLKEAGYDITPFFDELQDEEKETAKLNKLTINDILDKVEFGASALRTKYDITYVREEMKAGEETEELLAEFKKAPAFGALFQSAYLSTLWNGWQRGHLIMRSGNSGGGKTRMGVADLCMVGVKEMWDESAQDFVPNPNYQGPTLFIHSEQRSRTEVNPMFLASVADVEYRDIINGRTTDEQDKRIIKAGQILLDSNLTISDIPDFTSSSIHRKLKEMVEHEGICYAVFDYITTNSSLTAEFKQTGNIVPREDLIVKALATDLKYYAEELNIGILSGSQLNDNWKSMSFVDEGALASGKSMKNKVDGGSIIVPTSYLRKDMQMLMPLFNKKRQGFGEERHPLPNICEYIYKARYGQFGDKRLKIWTYFDRGTFRRKDYFITNDANEIERVPKTTIENLPDLETFTPTEEPKDTTDIPTSSAFTSEKLT